jgi:SpoVK/Ycf46/Vps4 family AAA+-type ATPase
MTVLDIDSVIDCRCVTNSDAVMVVGTCRGIELLDPSVFRPGRLDLHFDITLPDTAARSAILTRKLQSMPGAAHLVGSPAFATVVSTMVRGSGADIDNICREAALRGLREDIALTRLEERHLLLALDDCVRSRPPAL